MNDEAILTFVILGITIVLFVSDRIRLDVVALLSLLAITVTQLVPIDVALSGFSNAAVLMIAGLFVIGAAITETGVADWLGRKLERVAGESPTRVLAVVMLTTAGISAFMSSTGTVAIFLPVVGTIALRRGIPHGQLFMPLAFAAHLGSNLTLISTPPNLLVSDVLREVGRQPFRFFDFFVPGIVVLVVGIGYVVTLGRRFLPAGEKSDIVKYALSQGDLASEYGLGGSLVSARIKAESKLVGTTLASANLRADHLVTVVAILRGGESVRVIPRMPFAAGDVIRVLGSNDALETFITNFKLERLSGPSTFDLPPEESLAEVVLPRRSRLVGRTLREAKFRDRYRANVFAVRRFEGGKIVCHTTTSSLRDLTLSAGDTLLVKGRRKYLRNLQDEREDLVLLAEPDRTPGVLVDRPRALGSIAITLAMLVVMAFGWLPNVVAVLLAATIMVLTGCVRPGDVYRSINWESIVLIAGMIPLAAALERTGATTAVVSSLASQLQGTSPTVVLSLLVVITSALGMVLSNTATAVLVAPIAVKLANAFGVAPEPLLMGVAFAASAAFATPIASPVNVLVMTPGGYRFTDYVRMGLPLQLLVLTTAVLVIPLVWPF